MVDPVEPVDSTAPSVPGLGMKRVFHVLDENRLHVLSTNMSHKVIHKVILNCHRMRQNEYGCQNHEQSLAMQDYECRMTFSGYHLPPRRIVRPSRQTIWLDAMVDSLRFFPTSLEFLHEAKRYHKILVKF